MDKRYIQALSIAERVEHSAKYGGYYFYNYDSVHTPLFDGMKARIRF